MTNVLSTLMPKTATGNHNNGTEEAGTMAKYFLYVDESGDPGHNTTSTTHYVLVGLILMEDAWNGFFSKVKAFRSALAQKYRLRVRSELRAQDIWNAGGAFKRLGLSYAERYRLFREVALFLQNSPEISIIPV